MVLSMSRPSKHPKTGTYYFRKVVPADLRPLIGKTEEKRSLGTKDPIEAKSRHASVAAQVEQEWKTHRAKPEPLTNKQIVGLAGLLYHEFIRTIEAEPGPVSIWDQVLRIHELARERGALERWVGPSVDALLLREGIKTDEASRLRLIEAGDRALVQAAAVLRRNADGDYSEDPHADRFPKAPKAANAVSLTGLFDKWAAETKPAASTLSTWRGVVRDLGNHLEVRAADIRLISPDDIVRWKDALVAKGLAAKTINSSHLGCANTLFRHAMRNKLLGSNPAEGVKVNARAKPGTSKLPYTDEEVALILALAAKEDHPARRWPPLLAACTGARIGEITQLWGRRVMQRDGLHFLKIAPAEDEGSIKNEGSEREVPMHPALVASGFLDFVRQKGDGPLFYQQSSGRADKKHASKGVSNRIASWVREQGFTDPRKAPNHAFRHWFKTVASRVGVPDSIADAIQGHVTGGEASKYRHPELKTLADAMAKIPIPTTTS